MNKYRQLELQRKTNKRKEEYKYFVGTTLKNPLEYQKGEKIVFKIRGKYMDDYLDIPYINYSLISEDGKNEDGYIKKSDDGWFYIETSMSVCGFVYIKAIACDENKNPIEDIAVYNGSAGADVENILRATEIPADYEEFWNGLIGKVKAVKPEVLSCEKKEDINYPDFEIYDMRIKAPDDGYVSVMAAWPSDAEKESLSFAMFFQGYGVGSAIAKPLKDYFTVCVNAHCLPNCREDKFYADIRDSKLKGYGFDEEENKNPGTTYWAGMLMRDLQALYFFKDNELLNKKDYYFIGSSQGGMQACNMAAHFEKATAVIMNVPWLSDIYAHKLKNRREHTMPQGDGVTYFDTAVAAAYLKCPAYIISGLGDPTCNSSTQMALFNSINSKKYIEFYQNKVHSFTIPWDNNMYALGDTDMSRLYSEHTVTYYDWD